MKVLMRRKPEIVAALLLGFWMAAMGEVFFAWATSRPAEVLAPMREVGQ